MSFSSPTLPEVRLQDAVQALIEGPRGVVATPIVVVAVGVGEEVAADHRERRGADAIARCLPQSVEVVRDGAELGLLGWGWGGGRAGHK